MLSDSSILKKIQRQPKQSAGYKQLVRELGLHGGERQDLNDRLQKLVASGQLIAADTDRYAIPQAPSGKNLVAGKLSLHRDGFGFVIPELTSAAPNLKGRLSGDIFVPPHAIGAAMHGDRVLVEVTNVRQDGRAEGRLVRSIQRAHPTVVGLFHYGARHNYVTPLDSKIAHEIVIPKGSEYPGVDPGLLPTNDQRPTTGSPHRVLGDEASRRSDWSNLEKVVVDVEITDWPSATQNPRGRVVEILGHEDDFGVDVEIIIRKFHLPHRFPAEVLSEAQAIEPIISAAELRKRRDFRDLPIVTIDGETARDFDDAVLVTRLDNSNFELQVHIADVAHYVTPDSALDQEARLRGTSVYFPDRAVPMLPLELSTDICSLRPHVDRLVMSCIMEIDHRGEIVGYEICPGIIRSAERMTYTAVNAVLEGDEGELKRYSQLVSNFELMRALQIVLNKKRERRGSIDFDLPEPVIEFDENALMKSVTRSERNIAHRIIEEFMLSANECVAGYLEGKGIPSLYRIHEKPDAKRVYDFEVIAATFGYSLGVGPLPIQRMQFKTDRRSHYGTGKRPRELEIPKDVHITPRMYQKLTEKIAGKPEERILSYLMLRSLKQARYSEENEGHFALAATAYTHFTSPIRRYPDLIVHRILKEVLRDSAESWDGEVPIGTSRETQTHTVSGGHGFSRADRDGNGEGASAPASRREGHDFSRADKHHSDSRASAPEGTRIPDVSSEASLNLTRAVTPAPEGRLPIAQRSSAGKTGDTTEVPEGRPTSNEDHSRAKHPRRTDTASPWSKRREREAIALKDGPIPVEELHAIAEESSQSERRADEAERELMEWKKAKFMQDRVGEDFDGLIISVTKFGFFVELADLFVEGLVPLATLTDDRYTFHENTREIIGQRSRKTCRLGQKVHVLVDRIDPVEKKIQFALLEEQKPQKSQRKRRQ
jgi:ribonuclease R